MVTRGKIGQAFIETLEDMAAVLQVSPRDIVKCLMVTAQDIQAAHEATGVDPITGKDRKHAYVFPEKIEKIILAYLSVNRENKATKIPTNFNFLNWFAEMSIATANFLKGEGDPVGDGQGALRKARRGQMNVEGESYAESHQRKVERGEVPVYFVS